jgi:hypothetical protein
VGGLLWANPPSLVCVCPLPGVGLEFSEASEFARGIQLKEEAGEKPVDDEKGSHMGVDDAEKPNVPAPKPEPEAPRPHRSVVLAVADRDLPVSFSGDGTFAWQGEDAAWHNTPGDSRVVLGRVCLS